MQFSKNKNIIAAVKDEETLQLALESNVETIFVLSVGILIESDSFNKKSGIPKGKI